MSEDEHLLTCLIEECSEVTKECCKAQRFGLDDRPTTDLHGPLPTEGPTVRDKLVEELNDLLGAALFLARRGILPHDWFNEQKQEQKAVKIGRYMDYARRRGTITGE